MQSRLPALFVYPHGSISEMSDLLASLDPALFKAIRSHLVTKNVDNLLNAQLSSRDARQFWHICECSTNVSLVLTRHAVQPAFMHVDLHDIF